MRFSFHPRMFLALVLTCAAASCVSTLPSAEQMDAYQKAAREAHQEDYAYLQQQRASGQMSESQYELEIRSLDKRVQNEADNKAWSRHALAKSEMEANGIPTADHPIELRAPGMGSIPDSMYNTPRNNPMTGMTGNVLGSSGTY